MGNPVNVIFKFYPWSKDRWLSRDGSILPWDKVEHLILGLILIVVIRAVAHGVWWTDLGLFSVVAVGWEIRDGLMSHQTGGFSWKDLIADYVGYALGLALYFVVNGLFH